jgi:hypothetical protein
MSYIKFQNDPISKRFNSSYANLCAGDPTKKVLKLVDQCFNIVNAGVTEAKFCSLADFLYPVDSQLLIDFEVCANESLSIFDNQLELIPNSTPSGTPTYSLLNDRVYVRGLILYVDYPTIDKNGNDIDPQTVSCELEIVKRDNSTETYPLCQVFAHFANPQTQNAELLINKINIVNLNLNYSIKVKGLIVYVKSNSDPNSCSC